MIFCMKITLTGTKGARTGATIEGKGEIVAPTTDAEGWTIPATDQGERDELLAAAHEQILAEGDAWAGEAGGKQTTDHASEGYQLAITIDPKAPNSGAIVTGRINGQTVHGTVATPDDGGWAYTPAPGAEELDEDATETLLAACGEAVEEAGGTTPG